MGFLKNLSDKAKAKVGEIKSNVSKEDLLDLVSDARKTLAEGNGSDAAKWKAMGNLAMGLGKMASGKHQGSKEILENMHKDPYDIQMAEETKAELNSTLIQMLNPRKFIYGNPDVINEAGQFIVSNMHFINLVNDKTLLPKIHEYLNEKGIHYDEKTLDSEINKFIRSKDATEIMAVREHVDKYIFIDRMTKEEILSLNKNYHYNMEKHYLYKCEYCGRKFEDYPTTSSSLYKCDRHPAGVGQGPHKLHSIGQEKLWVD